MTSTARAPDKEQHGSDDVECRERAECASSEHRPESAADNPAKREACQQRQLEVAHRTRAERAIASGRVGQMRQQRRNAGGGQPFEGAAHHEEAHVLGHAKE